MKNIQIFTICLIGFMCMSVAASTPPKPVENFDISRYTGLWHQLSAIPASFQSDCLRNTTAEYSMLSNGLIKVVNSCDKLDKTRKSSEARARVNSDYDMDSTLEVTFVKIFKWIWSFGGDYWVLYVNKNYDVAIVGDPKREYGWILSKTPTLTDNEYMNLGIQLKNQGYDTCKFMMSETPAQTFSKNQSLCDYLKSI